MVAVESQRQCATEYPGARLVAVETEAERLFLGSVLAGEPSKRGRGRVGGEWVGGRGVGGWVGVCVFECVCGWV